MQKWRTTEGQSRAERAKIFPSIRTVETIKDMLNAINEPLLGWQNDFKPFCGVVQRRQVYSGTLWTWPSCKSGRWRKKSDLSSLEMLTLSRSQFRLVSNHSWKEWDAKKCLTIRNYDSVLRRLLAFVYTSAGAKKSSVNTELEAANKLNTRSRTFLTILMTPAHLLYFCNKVQGVFLMNVKNYLSLSRLFSCVLIGVLPKGS